MNGELTWKAAPPDSKAWRFWSSFCALSDGSAALEVPSLCMIRAALSHAGLGVGLLLTTMAPPPPATRELNHTVVPSYCAPWISMRPALGSDSACLMRPSHVVAGFLTRSLRYQSSCVLVLAGAAHTRPLYVAVFSGPGSVPWLTWRANFCGHALIQLASANSAVHTTSMPAMSMLESFAASRRTSDCRCWSASLESLW